MSQDPIGFAGGQSNLYEYVGNSPTNGTDPSGKNVYLETGNDNGGSCNRGLHQQICADTWSPSGEKTGKRCFSFGSIGDTGILSGIWSTGEVYEPDPVNGAIISGEKITTQAEDEALLKHGGHLPWHRTDCELQPVRSKTVT